MGWMTEPERETGGSREQEYREEYAFGTGKDGRSRLQRVAETFLVMADEREKRRRGCCWRTGAGCRRDEDEGEEAGPVGPGCRL